LLDTSKINLQQGLAASEQQGQPISAKFEVDDGKLLLSVYTAKDGKFSEVLVDSTTGKVMEGRANHRGRRPRRSEVTERYNGQGKDNVEGSG
jgi:hypothetical protein